MKQKNVISAIIVTLSTMALYYATMPESEIVVYSKPFARGSIIALSIESAIYYANLPDYEVLSSYSKSSSGGHRETDIDVAVYRQQYSEEMYRRIEIEHNRLNGEPETLTINLYPSDPERMKGINPYAVIYIDYANNIREITTYPF